MAEVQKYNPIIEENMETKGINTGRLKNTDLTRDIADNIHGFVDEQEKVKELLGPDSNLIVDIDDMTNEVARHAMAVNAAADKMPSVDSVTFSSEFDNSTDGSRIEKQHKQLDEAADAAREAGTQYDELQDQAKAIRDDMQPKLEVKENTNPS